MTAANHAAIEAVLQQWPRDFNDMDLPAVCGPFDDPGRSYAYAETDIREVLVNGDLATVTLFWPLTVTDAAGKLLDTVTEDGLDVFRRQPDGSWKIHLSHAFTRE